MKPVWGTHDIKSPRGLSCLYALEMCFNFAITTSWLIKISKSTVCVYYSCSPKYMNFREGTAKIADKEPDPQAFATYVFLHTESTGYACARESERMTEICLIAVSRDALEKQECHPRVLNKLLRCFNPMTTIQDQAISASGKHISMICIYILILITMFVCVSALSQRMFPCRIK